MIEVGMDILPGLAVWAALLLYYWGRGLEGKPGFGAVWRNGLARLRTGRGISLLLAGVAGMAFCLFLARRDGLDQVARIRNGAVFLWLLTAALIDAGEQIIPHALTLPGFIAWIASAVLEIGLGGSPVGAVLLFSLGGCLLGGGSFLLCRLVSRGGVGMGDIRVFGILGLFYGMNATFSLIFFTILLMTAYGLAMVGLRKKEMKSQVPMGPFILASYVLCCLFGI